MNPRSPLPSGRTPIHTCNSPGSLTGNYWAPNSKRIPIDRSCVDRILFQFQPRSRVTGFVQRNSRQPHSPADSGLRFTGIIFPDKWRSVLLTFTFVVVLRVVVLVLLLVLLGLVLVVLLLLVQAWVAWVGGLWLVVVVRRSRVLVHRRHHLRRMLRTLMSRRHHQARQQHRPRPRRNRTTAKTS